jgi:hypothetical protein
MELIFLRCAGLFVAICLHTYAQHTAQSHCPTAPKWTNLYRRVVTAHELLQNQKHLEARKVIENDSLHIFDDLHDAFTCSIGVASLFRTLSLTLMHQAESESTLVYQYRWLNHRALRLMHIAMNWLTYAFVVNGRNDGRWVDESTWPITIHAINEEETLLKRNLDKTGGSSSVPTLQEVPLTFRDPKLRIAIVSVCDYPPGNPLPSLSKSNRELYAQRHGYTLFEARERFDRNRPHAWAKVTIMIEASLLPDVDWLLWFDCDTYFMNLNVTLDYVLYKYGSVITHSGARALHEDFRMLIQEDHAMLNTGVFFMKTGKWARQLLQEVYGTDDSPWIHHPFWEQAAMHHIFLGRLPARIVEAKNSKIWTDDEMDQIYPDGVLVAPQWEINSYHPITSRLTMHDNWEPGKFVMAFSGCKSGSSQAVVNMLYKAYYDLMCRINFVENQCISMDEL